MRAFFAKSSPPACKPYTRCGLWTVDCKHARTLTIAPSARGGERDACNGRHIFDLFPQHLSTAPKKQCFSSAGSSPRRVFTGGLACSI